MTCPFLEAVAADDQAAIERMTSDCADPVTQQLVRWAALVPDGVTVDELVDAIGEGRA